MKKNKDITWTKIFKKKLFCFESSLVIIAIL